MQTHVLAGVAAIGVVGYTADLGGGLVFGHGVAVSTGGEDHGHAAEGGPSETPEIGADPAGRLIEGEDGRLTWRPAPSATSRWKPSSISPASRGPPVSPITSEAPATWVSSPSSGRPDASP